MKIRALFMTFTLALPLSFCFISPVQAEDEETAPQWAENEEVSLPWFVSIGTGIVSPVVNQKINFANSGMPGFPDDEYVTNDWSRSLLFSLSAGYQWKFAADYPTAFSLGLQYTYDQPQIKGDIYINSLADSKNFRYQYNVKQQLIQVMAKLNLFSWYELMPYLSLGAGIVNNNVNDYSESPIAGQTDFGKRYQFTSATTSQFAGSIGIGADYQFKDNMALTIGYRYTTTGHVQTGRGTGTLSGNRLTNTLSLNSLELQVLYFF